MTASSQLPTSAIQPDHASLAARLTRSGLRGVLLPAALLFIPAGTLNFWQGWAFMAVNLVFPALLVIYFFRRDPQLIERRLLKKESIREQKLLQKFGAVIFLCAVALAGLDYRLGWTRSFIGPVPWWLTLAALALILGGQLFIFWVVNVNRYAARVIQIETGQTVAHSGHYRIVRHPMYTASIVSWLAAPLALGSIVAWPAFALMVPLFVFRLLNEEKMLRRDLPGYVEYCQRTPCRLIPFIW